MEALHLTNNGDRLLDTRLYKKHTLEFLDLYWDYVSVMSHLRETWLIYCLPPCEITFIIMKFKHQSGLKHG
jgi:hypothetical protein